jgi:hypothetical protein
MSDLLKMEVGIQNDTEQDRLPRPQLPFVKSAYSHGGSSPSHTTRFVPPLIRTYYYRVAGGRPLSVAGVFWGPSQCARATLEFFVSDRAESQGRYRSALEGCPPHPFLLCHAGAVSWHRGDRWVRTVRKAGQ